MLGKNTNNLPDNWKELLENKGYKIIFNGSEYRTNAAYRDGKNNTSVVLFLNNGTFYDHGNSRHGKILELIGNTKDLVFSENENSKDNNGSSNYLKFIDSESMGIVKTFSEKGLSKLSRNFEYFGKRGISEDTQRAFDAYFCQRETFYNRIIFPIRNFNNKIIGFSGRLISWKEGDSYPKWIHKGPTNFFIYNHKTATPSILEKKTVILCESIGDSLSLYEAGFPNNLVLFGLNLSSSVIKYLISLNPDFIIIATNNDFKKGLKNNNGSLASLKIQKKLSNFFSIEKLIIKLPHLNDFNDILIKEGKDGIKKWYNSIDFSKKYNIIES